MECGKTAILEKVSHNHPNEFGQRMGICREKGCEESYEWLTIGPLSTDMDLLDFAQWQAV